MPGSRLASARPRLAAAPGCAGCLLRPGVRAWGVVRVQRGWPCLLPAGCVCTATRSDLRRHAPLSTPGRIPPPAHVDGDVMRLPDPMRSHTSIFQCQ